MRMKFWCVFSCRAGRGNVRTASGLSTGIAVAAVSGLVANNSSLTDIGVGISAINPISGRETTSSRDSGYGFSAELRLSRTCDRSTMVEVISARLMSAERVATGVGTSSRAPPSLGAARTKCDSLTGRLRPTLHSGFPLSTSAPRMAM